MSKAPDRGSFPLDHFHQCDTEAKKYSDCVTRHQLMPKRCRDFQMQYLQCRMKSGLMEEEEMKNLGFLEENSWETEQAERKHVLSHINKMKQQAWQKAKERAKNTRQSKPPETKLPE